MPVTRRPAKSAPSRRKADSFESMTATAVALALEDLRQRRPDPAAAHDDEVHARSSPVTARPRLTLRAVRPDAGVPVTAGAAQALASRDVSKVTDAVKRLLLGRAMRSDRLRRDAAAQADRAAGVRQRRAVLGGLRPGRDLPHPGASPASRPTPSPGRSACAVALVMLVVVGVLPAERARLPQRRRRLRGRHRQPRRRRPGSTVASALLVDYVLTVAVSISSAAQYAGVARSTSLQGHEVTVAVVAVVAAHRAAQPARRPRVGHGVRRPDLRVHGRDPRHGGLRASSGCVVRTPAGRREPHLRPERRARVLGRLTGLAGAFLLLRAFSSGCAALTGVEAISNGVPAFRSRSRRTPPRRCCCSAPSP